MRYTQPYNIREIVIEREVWLNPALLERLIEKEHNKRKRGEKYERNYK